MESGSRKDAVANLVLKLRNTRNFLRRWASKMKATERADKLKLLNSIQVSDSKEELASLSAEEQDLRQLYRLKLQEIYSAEEILETKI